MSTQLSDIGDRVGDLEEQMVKHNRRDYSGIWDQLHSLGDRADQLERRIPDEPLVTETDIEQVNQDVRTLSDRVDSLESSLSDVEATQNEFSEWAHHLDSRVQDLENRSLLDRVLPWR